jgi:hypothetical protein
VQRLDVPQASERVLIAPVEEPDAGPVVGLPGVLVADGHGEEFQEPARRLIVAETAAEILSAFAAGTTVSFWSGFGSLSTMGLG